MDSVFIERQMENALQNRFDDKVVRFVKGISRIAARQGGATTMENYQLLAKRALFVLGGVALTVQVISYVVSRRSEEQRIERVVRRVLEEERQKEEVEA